MARIQISNDPSGRIIVSLGWSKRHCRLYFHILRKYDTVICERVESRYQK
jgi:hypothetical protein